MSAKGFNLGSALMAIFIFFITGLFSWVGSETISNSKQNIRLSSTNVEVAKAVDRLNVTLDKVIGRIHNVEKNENILNTKLIKIEEHLKYMWSSK